MKACNQCGKCCIKYGGGDLSASADEIAQWELFNPDIFEFVHKGQIWCDPITKKPLSICPFLALEPGLSANVSPKYICSIYEDRPEDCRHYPSLVSEMIRDECEMIEITDLDAPKRTQEQLDILMQDSRPAYK
jgi:Fe-S-cluster containining protein